MASGNRSTGLFALVVRRTQPFLDQLREDWELAVAIFLASFWLPAIALLIWWLVPLVLGWFDVEFAMPLGSEAPLFLGKGLLSQLECGPDGAACLNALLGMTGLSLPDGYTPLALSVLAFVATLASLFALFVFIWVAWSSLAEGFKYSSPRNFGPSVSTPVAFVIGVGLPVLVLLAIWGGATDETGKVVEKSISPATGTYAIAGFVVALLLAGWAPVYERNAPFLRSRHVPIWNALEVPFILAFMALNLFARAVARVVNAIDYVLAQEIAQIAGTTLGRRGTILGIFGRYAVLFAVLFGLCAVIATAPRPIWFLAAGTSGLVVFAIIRRWSWIEEDRAKALEPGIDDEPSDETGIKIGFDQDLRDEAMTALAIGLAVITPIVLMRVDAQHIFAAGSDATLYSPSLLVGMIVTEFGGWVSQALAEAYGDWVAFTGGELVKALPFVDWSEVYPVKNGAPFSPTTAEAMHVVFALRATMDLLLLTAFVQAISITTRLAAQREEFDTAGGVRKRLDVFVERAVFTSVSTDRANGHDLALYEQERVRQVLRSPASPAVATGAAYLAGYQFAGEAIEDLITAVGGGADLRVEAARGIEKRAAQLRKTARRFQRSGQKLLAAVKPVPGEPPGARELHTVLSMDIFDALIQRLRGEKPDPEQLAASLEQVRIRRQIWEVAGGLSSTNESRSSGYYFTLQGLARSETLDALIELLDSRNGSARSAMCDALGAAGDPRAVPALIVASKLAAAHSAVPKLMRFLFEGEELQSSLSALGLLGDFKATSAIVEAIERGSESTRGVAAAALGPLGDPSAIPRLKLCVTDRRDFWTAYQSMSALGDIAEQESADALTTALRGDMPYPSPRLIKALSFTSSPAAVEARTDILTKYPASYRFVPTTLSLGDSGASELDARLEKLCDQIARPESRLAAAWLLARLGAPNTEAVISRQLPRESSPTRRLMLEAIQATLTPQDPSQTFALRQRIIDELIFGNPYEYSGTSIARHVGIWTLGKLGDRQDARALLAAGNRLYDREIVTQLSFALGRLRMQEGTKTLIDQTDRRRDLWVKRSAYLALGRIGGDVLPAIERGLTKDGNYLVRSAAALALAMADAEGAAQKLKLRIPLESDNRVRTAISIILASLTPGDQHGAAVPTIQEWASSDTWWRREIAAWSVAGGNTGAPSAIAEALRKDGNERVRDMMQASSR